MAGERAAARAGAEGAHAGQRAALPLLSFLEFYFHEGIYNPVTMKE